MRIFFFFAGETGWATAHFFLSVSHNTSSCIVTQGLTGRAWVHSRRAHGRPRYGQLGHDTAHNTAVSARVQGLAGGECVMIQSLYHDRSEGLAGCGWVTIQLIVS